MRDEVAEWLYGFLVRQAELSIRDPGTRDDLVQDGLIHLLRLATKYQDLPESEFRMLACRAIKNRMTSKARQRRAYQRLLGRMRPVEEYKPDLDRDVAAREILSLVADRLSRSARVVLDLTRRGFTQVDICRVMGMSPATVSRIMREVKTTIKEVVG